MIQLTYGELDKFQKKLLDMAEKAMLTAYNPYSRFYVGAAILSRDGKIITGSNVENAAYGSTICAERSAIVKANSMGIRMFDSIALIDRGENFDTTIITGPCGSCRQMLYEFSQISGKNLDIILSNTKKSEICLTTINELLPLAFGPKDLGVDIKRYQRE